MRVATLLLCLSLAACAGGTLPGEQPAATSGKSAGPAVVPSITAAPQGVAAHSNEPLPGSDAERQQQARVDCWMKVEHEKGVRDIDKRIAFVDRCVAGQMKPKP